MVSMNPDSAVKIKNAGSEVESWSSEGSPTVEFHSPVAHSYVVAMRLKHSLEAPLMSARRQKPVDFAAEGLRLELSVNRNCGIRV